MLQTMLKCKIHRATITDSNLNYEGSLTVDCELMKEAGLIPFEKVKVYNINNGERFDTYVIEGPAGSGTIALNGAAARKGMIGDLIIIASYAIFSAEELSGYHPQIVVLNPENGIKQIYNADNPPPIA
ncbi:MAG: aspartate 1-decarboxylase [Thermodesulfobacteriota bacterium]